MTGPASSAPVLAEVHDIAYAFNGVSAVRGVSFRVEAGGAVALVGANGAGKSTTVKMVTGILRPQAGKVVFNGRDVTALASHEIVEEGITMVPEGRLVFPHLTALENLQMGAHPRRARDKLDATLEWVLELFPPLAERRGQMAGLMSGGEQQMLAIARGLMSQPLLLMLDEPSLGLMPTMVEHLFYLITKVRESGISVVLVEQNVYQTLEIVDRAYVLEKGEITLEGTGREMLENDYVRKAFLGM